MFNNSFDHPPVPLPFVKLPSTELRTGRAGLARKGEEIGFGGVPQTPGPDPSRGISRFIGLIKRPDGGVEAQFLERS